MCQTRLSYLKSSNFLNLESRGDINRITMIYAEVTDPSLQQDYFRGIASLDPSSAQTESPQQIELRQLARELKTTKLGPKRRDEILERIQHLLASISVDDN